MTINSIVQQARNCTLCETQLTNGCRPVLRVSGSAPILIIEQAPGKRAHESGIPWGDPSGDRLRQWLGVDKSQFYNDDLFSILPMGLCYPGKGKSGDLPPMARCAPLWHERLRPELNNAQLTLLVGQYAQNYYLGKTAEKTLTATVENWEKYLPSYLPMPHPSPRNRPWLKRNHWFETRIVPWLSVYIQQLLMKEKAK